MPPQTERAYQKQPTIFQNKKRVLLGEGGKEKLPRYYKNIGLGFKTPKEVRPGLPAAPGPAALPQPRSWARGLGSRALKAVGGLLWGCVGLLVGWGRYGSSAPSLSPCTAWTV